MATREEVAQSILTTIGQITQALDGAVAVPRADIEKMHNAAGAVHELAQAWEIVRPKDSE